MTNAFRRSVDSLTRLEEEEKVNRWMASRLAPFANGKEPLKDVEVKVALCLAKKKVKKQICS